MADQDPYKECANCKDLGDCPKPDVATDGLGSPLPPDVCPRPMDIMKATNKKHKKKRHGDLR